MSLEKLSPEVQLKELAELEAPLRNVPFKEGLLRLIRSDTELFDIKKWGAQASCAQIPSSSLDSFSEKPNEKGKFINSVCSECPVRIQCLGYAILTQSTDNSYGVWGGVTSEDRKPLAKLVNKNERTSLLERLHCQ